MAERDLPGTRVTVLFGEIADTVGFSDEDAATLHRIAPAVARDFPKVIETFYDAILSNDAMKQIFRDQAQIDRQKRSLRRWLQEVFAGPYDDAYLARHANIGRVHERIGLAPHHMVGMMSVLRRTLVKSALSNDESAQGAVARILDVELAIMLGSFTTHDRTRRRAEERLLTLGQLAASIGHELRNPLAVIDSSVALLRRYELDEKSRKHVERIGSQTQLCSNIVGGLMDLARELPLDLRRTELLAFVQQSTQGDQRIRCAGTPVEVDIDRDLLRRLLINLLDNAFQVGASSVEVAVEHERDEAVLTVCDDGPGIPLALLPTLFEPLVTARTGGTGLGLALCRRIAKEHHGTIRVENTDEGGALFELRLPIAKQTLGA